MKSFLATASLMTAILACGCAQGQVGTNPMALGLMSLNMSPPALGAGTLPDTPVGSLVGPVGVPLGSTELAVSGLSPAPAPIPGCPTTAMTGSQTSTAPFDGGGLGTAMTGNCPALGDSGLAANQPATMPGMPALNGRQTGIPLGSTEIANPGLSPPPPPTPLFAPTPTSPMGSNSGSTSGGNP